MGLDDLYCCIFVGGGLARPLSADMRVSCNSNASRETVSGRLAEEPQVS